MLKIKGIINNIIQGIASNKGIPRTIDISEDRIIDKLLAEKNSNSFSWRHLGQISLLSIVVLSFLYILVSMILFFIFDVILFEPRVYTTANGATVITQPCGVEQAFFIHNSANNWTNSGIDIVEGDKISLSYSGSFYSTLRDLANASKKTEVAKYDWSSVYRVENTPRSIVKYCLFNDTLAYIGSLLYRIGNNKETDTETKISQMIFSNGIFSFDAPCSGPFQITANDIYVLDTDMVNEMLKEKSSVFDTVQKHEIIKRLDFHGITGPCHNTLCSLVDSLDSLFKYQFINKSKSNIIGRINSYINRLNKQEQWDYQQIGYNDNLSKFPETSLLTPDSVLIYLSNYQKRISNDTQSLFDSIYSQIDSFVSQAQWDAQEIWYNDNIGELFVTVQIIRDNLNYANPINKLFAKLYRHLDSTWERKPFIFITLLLLCALAYLQLLIFYSFWKSLCNSFWNKIVSQKELISDNIMRFKTLLHKLKQ